MKTTRQQALDWWNTLNKIERDDLALDYYGSTLIMDSEIEYIWLREVPQEKVYTETEIRKACTDAFNEGMDLRLRRLNGGTETVEDTLNNFLSNFFAGKANSET